MSNVTGSFINNRIKLIISLQYRYDGVLFIMDTGTDRLLQSKHTHSTSITLLARSYSQSETVYKSAAKLTNVSASLASS